MRELRFWVFRHRGLIPIPFLLGVVLFGEPTYLEESFLDELFDIVGVTIIVCGLALRAWAVGHAGSHTRSYKLRAPRLVTSGPYAYVRNPIYLGNLIIGLGIVILAESWVALVMLLIVFSVEYGAIVSLEEEFLFKTFGERYEEYRRLVPRWVPRLTPVQIGVSDRFSWRALRKEYLAALSASLIAGIVELAEELHRLVLR